MHTAPIKRRCGVPITHTLFPSFSRITSIHSPACTYTIHTYISLDSSLARANVCATFTIMCLISTLTAVSQCNIYFLLKWTFCNTVNANGKCERDWIAAAVAAVAHRYWSVCHSKNCLWHCHWEKSRWKTTTKIVIFHWFLTVAVWKLLLNCEMIS